MIATQFQELLLQALEHERAGALVYQTALDCVVDGRLRREWEIHLAEARCHAEVLTGVCQSLRMEGRMWP